MKPFTLNDLFGNAEFGDYWVSCSECGCMVLAAPKWTAKHRDWHNSVANL